MFVYIFICVTNVKRSIQLNEKWYITLVQCTVLARSVTCSVNTSHQLKVFCFDLCVVTIMGLIL